MIMLFSVKKHRDLFIQSGTFKLSALNGGASRQYL